MWILVGQIAAVIVSLTTIIGAVIQVVKVSKSWLERTLEAQLEPIRYELQPNSGGSLKDAVNEIRNEVRRLGYATAIAEARLNALVAHSDDAWLETNEFGDVVDCNAAYCRLLDIPKSEVLNGSLEWRDRVPPEDLARLDAVFQQQLVLHGTINSDIRLLVENDLVPIEMELHPVREFDKFRGWAGSLTPFWDGANVHDGTRWPAPPAREWLLEARSKAEGQDG